MFRVPTRLAQVATLGEARILQDMLTPMHHIEPLNVFLGSLAAAHDAELLASKGITHIVNCLGPADVRHPDRFAYLTLDVPEAESSSIKAHFDVVNAWVDAAVAGGGAVLIHCRSGEHRSACVVSAYRMHKLGEAAADSAIAVQRIRSNVDIPPSYRLALLAYDADLATRRGSSGAAAAAAADGSGGGGVPAVLPPAEAAARGRAALPTDPASFVDPAADAARMLREHGEDRVIGDMLSHIQQVRACMRACVCKAGRGPIAWRVCLWCYAALYTHPLAIMHLHQRFPLPMPPRCADPAAGVPRRPVGCR